MTYTEVLELIRAGYNKQEIEAMMAAETPAGDPKEDAKKDPQPDPQPEKKPDIVKADPEPEKTVKEESETEKLIKALGLRLDNLTKSIQASNVNGIEGDGGKEQSADDIVAKLINPHYGEVK